MITDVPGTLENRSDHPPASALRYLFPVNPGIAIGSMLAVWGTYFLFATIYVQILQPPSPARATGQYLLLTGFALATTWVLYRVLAFLGSGRISSGLTVLIIPGLALALLISWFGMTFVDQQAFFSGRFGGANLSGSLAETRAALLLATFVHFLILASWGCGYLAWSHDRATQKAMEKSRLLDRLTRESELRALRFQLNPHFVFNALNSVSSLIIDRRNSEAEQLVEQLADLMRVVLDEGQHRMTTVEKEIEQQSRYLEIEKVRFPDRLNYSCEIAVDVRDWEVPVLIIQPLVENAIKHGVAQFSGAVRVEISARRDGDRLRLVVANDGAISGTGTEEWQAGTGLANVRERLKAVYGYEAALETGHDAEGFAVATIIVPDAAKALQVR
ncbi:Histidine kinase [Parasphingorhabdus marina DSM 22363]|uniref:Histidine kinase n=1 Tax=Parasphingorhabdus marina DSM 22363 TaxID=1123272 RepID=A0A1N6D5L9_9SPHN|nr:histidine kinase [Parasphingorhabdus marina]SIN66075.1 Histidine kinase [Parasphingorhabdus marina DSM 22363]